MRKPVRILVAAVAALGLLVSAPACSTTKPPQARTAPTTTTPATTTPATTTVAPPPKPATTSTPPTSSPVPTTAPTTVLSIAESQIGKAGPYTEGGNWCAKFVSWVEEQAHTPGWISSIYPGVLETYARQSGVYTTKPTPGDVAFMDLTNHGGMRDGLPVPASHVGIVESVNGSTVVTIDGNADNSGVVTVQTHVVGDYLYGFGHWPAP